ncbi:MAG: carbamoyltransferase HypF [Raoultibacter sp.]
MIEALSIHVQGIVQGVGFRPFVYRMAKKYLITGWVLNAADGVFIHAEAEAKLLDAFVLELSENPPAAARVTEIELREVPLEGFEAFEIRFSDAAAVEKTTLVSPDLATCDDCVGELFNRNDRRYRYPFINCTNCGPRFTIIEKLPYDRKNTSMAAFPMCTRCAQEYGDPLDRRFHAQPDACFECGPHLSWRVGGGEIVWGNTRAQSDAILADAVALLRQGGIVAIKGLGGFHLACDAENAEAIAQLRRRKRREGKAFAVMAPSLAAACALCQISPEEEALLCGAQHPIVLLKKKAGATFAPGLADGLVELGLMLPYTPLQHLLLHDFGGTLVMTSGNLHDEPIVTDDTLAYEALAGIADAFVGNDRAIRSRYDDSVVRLLATPDQGTALQFIRRARGYTPLPILFPTCDDADVADSGNAADAAGADTAQAAQALCLLATGPEQKNTFCLTRGNEAFVSQHIGDMENAATFDSWRATTQLYQHLFRLQPSLIACDKHPEYLATKWATEQEEQLVYVQHHHAHIAAVMAENKLTGPVCGIAFDGTGYGEDGALWGGEVLLANLQTFERFANFAYFPLPGGAAAIKHPLRAAYGVLWAFDLLEHPAAQEALAPLEQAATLCGQMIDRGINTPLSSSVGRLFDAASALLGICTEPTYEGEGAILLEAAIAGEKTAFDKRYTIGLIKNTATEHSTALDTSVVLFDAAPLFGALLDDVAAGVSTAVIARHFHDAFVDAIVTLCQLVQATYGITTVALGGGVFMNRYLTEQALAALSAQGFTVAINQELPPNDGCLSYGQAVVAANQSR